MRKKELPRVPLMYQPTPGDREKRCAGFMPRCAPDNIVCGRRSCDAGAEADKTI